jgi:hypothetical protein
MNYFHHLNQFDLDVEPTGLLLSKKENHLFNNDYFYLFTILSRRSDCAKVLLSSAGYIISLFRYNSRTPYVVLYLNKILSFFFFSLKKKFNTDYKSFVEFVPMFH